MKENPIKIQLLWPFGFTEDLGMRPVSSFVPVSIILCGLFSLAQVLVWSYEDRSDAESSLGENMENCDSERMIERRRHEEGWRKEDCAGEAVKKYANIWKKKAKAGKWQKYVYNPDQFGCFRRSCNLIYLVLNNVWQNFRGEFAH